MIDLARREIKLDWQLDDELTVLEGSPYEESISALCGSFKFYLARESWQESSIFHVLIVSKDGSQRGTYSVETDSLELALENLKIWMRRQIRAFSTALGE